MLRFLLVLYFYLCDSIYFTTSPTVVICSRSSDGISTSKASSNAITISKRSRESAPRSSLKDVVSLNVLSSQCNDSATISFTVSNMILFSFLEFTIPSGILPM